MRQCNIHCVCNSVSFFVAHLDIFREYESEISVYDIWILKVSSPVTGPVWPRGFQKV